MSRIEIPTYLVDRAALVRLLRDGALPPGNDVSIGFRLASLGFIEPDCALTEKGEAAAVECERLAKCDPFTGKPR